MFSFSSGYGIVSSTQGTRLILIFDTTPPTTPHTNSQHDFVNHNSGALRTGSSNAYVLRTYVEVNGKNEIIYGSVAND